MIKKIPVGRRILKYILITLAVTSIINQVWGDIVLGSIADVRSLTLSKGEIGEYKASFFNLGDKPLSIDFTLEYPGDLKVEIHPRRLTIHPGVRDTANCAGCEFFVLKDGKTYVRTYPVHLYVKIPPEISRNIYEIKLTAKAYEAAEESGSGVKQSLVQVREIIFTAYVPGALKETTTFDASVKVVDVKEESEKEAKEKLGIHDLEPQPKTGSSQKTSESRSSSGGGNPSGNSGENTASLSQNNNPVKENTGSGRTGGGLGIIEPEPDGGARIKLPTGDVVLSKQDSDTVIDLGLITLAISVISLLVKAIK